MSFSVCIVSAQYLPHIGGVEMYVQKLSKQLVKNDVKVTIVTSALKGLPNVETLENGIEVYRLPAFQLMNTRLPVLKRGKKTRKLSKQLESKHFDLVVVNTRFYLLSLFGVKFAYKNNIKCVLIEHGTAYLTLNNAPVDFVIKNYEKAITKKVKKYCKDFYGVSKACCEWLENFGIKAKGTVYNSIDTEYIDKIISNKDYRKDLNIPKDAPVVAFVGRVVEEKGILQLIKAIKDINNENKKVYLLIAGNGTLEGDIKQQQDKYIKYLGKLEFCDVLAMLKTSDIFCLPSRSEGFPTVVLEATYEDCYVIATEKGGAKELIIDDSYGTIIKENSSECIKEAILCICNDTELREKCVQRAKDKLLENFTSQKVCEDFMEKFVVSEDENESTADNTGI